MYTNGTVDKCCIGFHGCIHIDKFMDVLVFTAYRNLLCSSFVFPLKEFTYILEMTVQMLVICKGVIFALKLNNYI